MSVKVFSEKDYITTEWNGGKTTQMYISPKNENYGERNFKLRLSSATIATPISKFTEFNNMDRILMTLDNKIELEHGEHKKIMLNPFEPHYFAGDNKTISRGCCVDFNVMLQRNSYTKAELFHNGAGQFDLYADADDCFLYVYEGSYKVITKNGNYSLDASQLMHLGDFSAGKIIRSNIHSKMVVCKINW
ncbi:HutD family protein [Pectinatus sottacetonis]|uniref:HutD family protein n=1 Tax=Pectinatus sottacetonis TaxID=1002795 RepID=UPI0018C5FFA4|nr:HutD family protein [Pectinatus sottacetonis]